MEVFEIVIALLLGGAILAAVARRIGTPYPALRTETLRAALDAVRDCGGGEGADLLRRRYELRLRTESDPEDAEIVRVATLAERRRLIELRDVGTIGDTAFQQVEQELEVRELDSL